MNAPDEFHTSTSVTSHAEGLDKGDEGWETGARAGFVPFVEIPFLYRRLILGSLLASLLVAWLAILFWPRTYQSEAKMLILGGRESGSLGPTGTTGAPLMVQTTREGEINAALEVLGSRAVAELVVDELGEDAILTSPAPSAATPRRSLMARYATMAKKVSRFWLDVGMGLAGIRDNISDRERAITRVQETVRLHSPERSNVITVRGKAESPKMAQALVKSITKNFVDIYVKLPLSDTTGTEDFFAEQIDGLEKQLNGLVETRSEFLKQNKNGSLQVNRKLLTDQFAAVDAELSSAKSQLTRALAEIRDLNQQHTDALDEVVTNKIESSDAAWSVGKQRLDELLLKEKELSATYADDHAKLKQVRDQIVAAQAILQDSQSGRLAPSRTVNPARLRLIEEVQKQETRVGRLRSGITVQEEQRRDLEEQSKKLSEQERHIQQLDQEIAVREGSLISLREILGQSRAKEQPQRTQFSSVNVFQDATLVEKATTPNQKILALGIVPLGLLFGFGYAFLRERTSGRLRTAAQVEAAVGAHVLMSVPFSTHASPLSSAVRDSRKSRLRDVCKSILSDVLFAKAHAARPGIRGRTLGVLSIHDGCGASTVAAVLGLAATEDCGLRTTLIDADLIDKTVSRAFGLDGAPKESEPKSDPLHATSVAVGTTQEPLNLVSGFLETGDRVGSLRFLEFQHDYDLIIVDLPPAGRLDQATAMTQGLDFIILVVESNVTEAIQLQRVVRRLEAANACVVGVVLNKVRDSMPPWVRSIVT